MAVAEREIVTSTGVTEPHLFRWTLAQYQQLGDLGWFQERRVELIEGVIIEMPPIGAPHWTAVNLTNRALLDVFGPEYVVSVQSALNAANFSQPQPDIAVIEGNIRQFSHVVPNVAVLVVEISDTSLAYDRTRKAAVYARADIAEYWIVNLESHQVEVHRQPGSLPGGLMGYADIQIYRSGQSLTPLSKPGAAIAVDDLLP